MDYIIIGLLSVVIILLIVVIVSKKRNNNSDIVERLGKMETKLTKDILDFINDDKNDFNKLKSDEIYELMKKTNENFSK